MRTELAGAAVKEPAAMGAAVENHMMDDRYKHDSNTSHAEHSLLIRENSYSGNDDTDEENQKCMYSYFLRGSIFHKTSSLFAILRFATLQPMLLNTSVSTK